MKKTILKTECPYCGSKDLKEIGQQEGLTCYLVLANCTNEKCRSHTIVIAKIEKEKAA